MANGLPASSAANSCNSLIFWAVKPLGPLPATASLLGLTPARRLRADRLFGLPRGILPQRESRIDRRHVQVLKRGRVKPFPPGSACWRRIGYGEMSVS